MRSTALPHRPLHWAWIAALCFFILAGATGALLRFGLIYGLPANLNYVNVRHAHSHLMYFGWVTPALMALIASRLPLAEKRDLWLARFRRVIGVTFLLALLAYLSFLLYGYQVAEISGRRIPLSVIAASLNVTGWYAFAWFYARATWRLPRTQALRLWDAALAFLILASLGAWGLGLARPLNLTDPFISLALTYLFLDLFANGWFVLAVLGLAYATFPTAAAHPLARWGEGLLLMGLPAIFLLSLPGDGLSTALRFVAGLGGVLVAAGLLVNLWVLWPVVKEADGHAWKAPLFFLGLKAAAVLLIALPAGAIWAESMGLRISYLHWLLLGFVSLGLVAAAADTWENGRMPWRWFTVAVLLLILSLIPLSGLWPLAWSGRWAWHLAAWLALGPVLAAVALVVAAWRTSPFHVVIVGGGITGLSAAWYLQNGSALSQAAQSGPISYTLLEQSGRWGGKIYTEQVGEGDGQPFVVEAGPDSFISQKPWAWQLARELGLDERILPANSHKRPVYVLNKGRLEPLPDGIFLMVPTNIKSFLRSRLISLPGKIRMTLDWFIPARRDDEDETLADFVKRRLGREALDKLAEPLMSGIYNAEAERQSVLATFPNFRLLEKKHGSLIRGMLAQGAAQGAAQRAARGTAVKANGRTAANANGRAPHKPAATFLSFKDGMEELVRGLQSQLVGECRLNTGVEAIRPCQKGGYELTLSDGRRLIANAVILAVPAYTAARLIEPLVPEAAVALKQIRYVSTGTLSLAFDRDDVHHPLDGSGLVIPRGEQRPINAITWSSSKFARRSPEGCVLLRVFFGGSRNPDVMNVDDEELLALVRRELESVMGITAVPLFHRIHRCFDATPQYDLGHLARMDRLESLLPRGLYVTGSPYRGIGIPDCIHQAQQTAVRIMSEMD